MNFGAMGSGSESVRPPGAPPGYGYAGPGIRLLAFLVDGFVVFALFMAVFIGFGAFAIVAFPSQVDPDSDLLNLDLDTWPAGAVIYAATSVVSLAWYGGWQAGRGATPGMLLFKLRVRGPSGETNPTFGAAVKRNGPQVLLNFGALSGIEAIDALLGVVTFATYIAIGVSISNSQTRQGFHDRLAGGTYVLRRGG